MLADVQDVVLSDFIGGQDEREAVLDVVEVFLGHHEALQGGLRRKDHVLDLASLVVEGHVKYLLVHSVGRVAVEGHDLDVLPEGVLITRLLELFFLAGEALDDLLDRGPGGRRFVERAFLRACRLGQHDDRQQDAKQ